MSECNTAMLREIIARGLVAGLGTKAQTCIEGAISLACGGELNDSPPCVATEDRAYSIAVNDAAWSSPQVRAEALLPLAQAGSGSAAVVVNHRADSVRAAYPLFQAGGGGAIPTSALHARDLTFGRCPKRFAVQFVREFHSRLPRTQWGPWQYAFAAEHAGTTYAVALWNTPSARCLPQHWLELRRMACSDDAPPNTASRFLGWMLRYFRKECPERERLISYQDEAVHKGTIYRACGWIAAHRTVARVRNRSKPRVGTARSYRSNINGDVIDAGSKIRWEIAIIAPAPDKD